MIKKLWKGGTNVNKIEQMAGPYIGEVGRKGELKRKS